MQFEHSEILALSPLGIVVCDADQRILWCNSLFLEETELVESNVVGKLYNALPIETFDKHAYLVQYFNEVDKSTKKFRYWQTNMKSTPSHLVHYFVMVRDKEFPEDLKTPKLPQRPNWTEFLDYEVSRSRRYNNPLSLLKLQLLINSNPDKIDQQQIFQIVKDSIMDELRWADMIANNSYDGYLMILPETPSSAIDNLMTKLINSITTQLNILSSKLECQVIYGSSHWQKHDDSQQMLKRARLNLVEKLEKSLKSTS